MDYGRLEDHLLNFTACQRQSCVDIPIVDDEVLEDLTELFSLTLKRPSGPDDSISLSPVDGMVQITDDDGMYSYYLRPAPVTLHWHRLTTVH